MTWLSMVLVGLGSYLFRVVPLLVLPQMTLPARVDRALRHAGAAALTALVVSSVSQRAEAGDLGPTLAAVAVGVTLAVRRASMLRIVAAGGLVYATALAAAGVVG